MLALNAGAAAIEIRRRYAVSLGSASPCRRAMTSVPSRGSIPRWNCRSAQARAASRTDAHETCSAHSGGATDHTTQVGTVTRRASTES